MNHINFYCYSWGSSLSGGSIFDTKLVEALSEDGDVLKSAIPVFRKWTLPVWKKHIGAVSRPRNGGMNIVSHEGLHEILNSVSVDCYIVHNYFTEFDFPKLRFINPLYRCGSEKIYHKIFSASKRVIFLSARERRLASERYPELSEKFLCNPPGHNEGSTYFSGTRDASVIEIPGTLDWLPKKISYRLNIAKGLPGGGTLVRGDSAEAFISVIYDAFLSGFKLKLVEMAKHGKSIISYCDLKEELVSIGFEDLPYVLVGNRSELRDAIAHFRQQGDLSQERRQSCYRSACQISWTRMAKAAIGV